MATATLPDMKASFVVTAVLFWSRSIAALSKLPLSLTLVRQPRPPAWETKLKCSSPFSAAAESDAIALVIEGQRRFSHVYFKIA